VETGKYGGSKVGLGVVFRRLIKATETPRRRILTALTRTEEREKTAPFYQGGGDYHSLVGCV
jgi:hypothetical protein